MSSASPKKYQSRLQQLREQAGLTRVQLAVAAEIGHSTLKNYESGKRLPDQEKAASIAAALRVSIEDIWAHQPLPSYDRSSGKALNEHTAGYRLRQARKSAGLSQQQLAQRVGLTQTGISTIETHNRKPRYEIRDRISRALSMQPTEIWPEHEDPTVEWRMPSSLTEVRHQVKARRIEMGYSYQHLADLLDVDYNPALLAAWEEYGRKPNQGIRYAVMHILGLPNTMAGVDIPDEIPSRSGYRLRHWRLMRNQTLHQLAVKVGVSHQWISMLEKQKVWHRTPQLAPKLADALDISLEDLLGLEEHPSKGE